MEADSHQESGPATYELVFRRLVMCVLVYAIPAVWVMRPVDDADIWWHLRAGQWIVEHRTATTTDPFSLHGQDKPWLAYSWLFEVLVYGLYSWLGLTGLLLYRVVMSLAVVVAFHWFLAQRESRYLLTIGLLALGVMACIPIFTERPWLFTILFVTATLHVVANLREGRATRAIWLLPLGYVIWGNIHIQFVYGLFILALGCAAPVLDGLFRRPETTTSAARWGTPAYWQLVALTGLCSAATLVNPYHVRLYFVIWEYATQPAAFRFINELTPPTYQPLSDLVMLGLAGAAAFALGFRGRRSTFEILLLAAACYFAFRAKRDVWFVVLAAYAVFLTPRRASAPEAERFPLTAGRIAVAAVAIALVLVGTGLVKGLSEQNLEAAVARAYPVEAANFIEANHLPGPMFNYFDWGGYLIWRIPRVPVQIDGRTNLHGDERIERAVATWAGKPSWEADPELDAANLVIAPRQQELTRNLRGDPRFVTVYEDAVAVVFVKREGAR